LGWAVRYTLRTMQVLVLMTPSTARIFDMSRSLSSSRFSASTCTMRS